MPMLFLNIRTASGTISDPEGTDFVDLSAARSEAVRSARELWSEGILGGADRRLWVIEIANPADEILQSVCFSDTARQDP